MGLLVVTKSVRAILVLSIFHRSLHGDEKAQVPLCPLATPAQFTHTIMLQRLQLLEHDAS